MTTA
ncbi:hypothetical protein NP493_413g02051 [Ridgeia piscesae]|jgi:uncharacterized protein